MLIEFGAHNVVSVAVNTGTGTGFVVTVIEPGAEIQPADDVAVAVYVVLPAGGVTEILAVVAPVDQLYDAEGPVMFTK